MDNWKKDKEREESGHKPQKFRLIFSSQFMSDTQVGLCKEMTHWKRP